MSERRKTILILAASTYQVPFIEKARTLGLRVLTADNVPSNPGHALADRSFDISTTDRERLLMVAQEEKIDGVLAPCTDVAVPTAAFLSAKLGLPGVPEEAVEVLCCKTMFRNYLKEKGWPVPAFCPLDHCAGFLGKPGLELVS